MKMFSLPSLLLGHPAKKGLSVKDAIVDPLDLRGKTDTAPPAPADPSVRAKATAAAASASAATAFADEEERRRRALATGSGNTVLGQSNSFGG